MLGVRRSLECLEYLVDFMALNIVWRGRGGDLFSIRSKKGKKKVEKSEVSHNQLATIVETNQPNHLPRQVQHNPIFQNISR